jgi:ATP-dependent helicase HrpB
VSAAAIEQAEIEMLFADRIETKRLVTVRSKRAGRSVATRERRLGAIRLSGVVPIPMPIPKRSPPGFGGGRAGISGSTCCRGATAPLRCVSAPAMSGASGADLSDAALLARTRCEWLPPLVDRAAASSPTYPAAR